MGRKSVFSRLTSSQMLDYGERGTLFLAIASGTAAVFQSSALQLAVPVMSLSLLLGHFNRQRMDRSLLGHVVTLKSDVSANPQPEFALPDRQQHTNLDPQVHLGFIEEHITDLHAQHEVLAQDLETLIQEIRAIPTQEAFDDLRNALEQLVNRVSHLQANRISDGSESVDYKLSQIRSAHHSLGVQLQAQLDEVQYDLSTLKELLETFSAQGTSEGAVPSPEKIDLTGFEAISQAIKTQLEALQEQVQKSVDRDAFQAMSQSIHTQLAALQTSLREQAQKSVDSVTFEATSQAVKHQVEALQAQVQQLAGLSILAEGQPDRLLHQVAAVITAVQNLKQHVGGWEQRFEQHRASLKQGLSTLPQVIQQQVENYHQQTYGAEGLVRPEELYTLQRHVQQQTAALGAKLEQVVSRFSHEIQDLSVQVQAIAQRPDASKANPGQNPAASTAPAQEFKPTPSDFNQQRVGATLHPGSNGVSTNGNSTSEVNLRNGVQPTSRVAANSNGGQEVPLTFTATPTLEADNECPDWDELLAELEEQLA